MLFTTMSSLGFLALGEDLSANIINSLPMGDFRMVAQIAFSISLTTATYTLINPVFRQVEGPLKIEGPGKFGERRRLFVHDLEFVCFNLQLHVHIPCYACRFRSDVERKLSALMRLVSE